MLFLGLHRQPTVLEPSGSPRIHVQRGSGPTRTLNPGQMVWKGEGSPSLKIAVTCKLIDTLFVRKSR